MKKVLLIVFLLTACVTSNKPLIATPPLPPKAREIQNIDVALVLGGGGSRGVAHIGVLKVLEENNIPVDLIVGCSAGSIIGALYADSPDADVINKKINGLNKWEVLDTSILDSMQIFTALKGPVRGHFLQKFIIKNLQAKQFEDLKIPLVIATTDLDTNESYVIRSGPLAPAVNASAAIPPVFSPVKLYGRMLVDGGVKYPVPVAIAKLFKPKVIIAVDISTPPPYEKLYNMLDLTYRSIWILYYELARQQTNQADIQIHPKLAGHGMFEDDKKELLYDAGVAATREQIPNIKKKLKQHNIPLKPHIKNGHTQTKNCTS